VIYPQGNGRTFAAFAPDLCVEKFPRRKTMQIEQIMTRNVEIISPNTPLREAAQKMRDLDVGSLPVCDGQRLQGMLTDRDITIRATAEGHNPDTTRAADVMTAEIFYCYDDQDIKEAAKVMEDKQIRRLPIVNRDKMLVGIVSLGDLAVDGGKRKLAGGALTEISRPSKPER
jgi:CBS domain-containing protein